MFPRIAALAEAAWSTVDVRDFADFQRRLPVHLKRYAEDKLYYYHPTLPDRHPEPMYQP